MLLAAAESGLARYSALVSAPGFRASGLSARLRRTVALVEPLTVQSPPALSWRNSAALCWRKPSALNCEIESVPLTSPARPEVQLCHL